MYRNFRAAGAGGNQRHLVAAVAIIAWLSGILPSASLGADDAPVLVVAGSQRTLHLAVPLPSSVASDRAAAWQLVEVDNPGVVIAAQQAPAITGDGLADEQRGRLIADIPPRDGAGQQRRFRLQGAEVTAAGGQRPFEFRPVDDSSLGLWEMEKPVMVYNHGTVTNPEVPSTDHRRSRACYIHPVWGLGGEVLTDDFPRDHYHHHGIFWTWPHVGIEGQQYDLWAGDNIRDEFTRWICRQTGPAGAVLAVENGWCVDQKKVMIERVWMRAYPADETHRAIDLEFTWIPIDKPVTLWGAEGKSYGGLTMRFAPPSRTAVTITVPSGRVEDDLKETPLPWADFTCKFQDQPAASGAALFVAPDHPDYPPTWLTRHYGPLCVGWPGVKPKTFPPGEPIRLSYRIWIHKGAVDTDQLQQAYEDYVAAKKATWQ